MISIGRLGSHDIRYCAATDAFVVLDPVGTAIVDAFAAGASPREVEDALAVARAGAQSPDIALLWQHFSASRPPGASAPASAQAPGSAAWPDDRACHLRLDCGSVAVTVRANAAARQALFAFFERYFTTLPPGDDLPCVGSLWLTGHSDGLITLWTGSANAPVQTFHGAPGACFVEAARAVSELACNYPSRLAVLHAATLVRDDKTILLINPSGAGKTTLAWLMTTAGFTLVHDDCLPVNPGGDMSQILSPSTLKQGSWSVLEKAGLTLHDDVFARNATRVRYHPIAPFAGSLTGQRRHVLFVRYAPGCSAGLQEVEAVDAFTRLIQDDCVIHDRSIDRLTRLFDWIVATRAAELHYSRFEDALVRVEAWLRDDHN